MRERIIGIDVARALAVVGMVIVNFKLTFGEDGPPWVTSFASFFEGKAVATFVVLAGVGLALMTNSAIQSGDPEKLKTARNRILKRALFLFIVGLSYITIWPADILHVYGVYMLMVVLLLTSSDKIILGAGIVLIIGYPLLMVIWNYETGWNFDTLDYQGFWTVRGFVRNLFFNGFNPAIPWAAFMLFGYWFGRQNLHNEKFVKRTLLISSVAFVSIQWLSNVAIATLASGHQGTVKELTEILGTSPMPPLPIYMLNGTAIAFTIIAACMLVSKRFEHTRIVGALNKTGRLALTFYVAHVVVGMGVVEMINPAKMGNYTVQFSVAYALVFSLFCGFFAIVWLKYHKVGPLEWVMRRITG